MNPGSQIVTYFEDYYNFHKNKMNQICHAIGIPAIMISLLGLLGSISFESSLIGNSDLFRFDLGILLWLGATFWYLKLDWKLGGPFSLVSLGTYFLGRSLPLQILWVLFVLGWVFQGVGHAIYEKRSPAFLKNFVHIFIGPLWIFSKLIGANETQK